MRNEVQTFSLLLRHQNTFLVHVRSVIIFGLVCLKPSITLLILEWNSIPIQRYVNLTYTCLIFHICHPISWYEGLTPFPSYLSDCWSFHHFTVNFFVFWGWKFNGKRKTLHWKEKMEGEKPSMFALCKRTTVNIYV